MPYQPDYLPPTYTTHGAYSQHHGQPHPQPQIYQRNETQYLQQHPTVPILQHGRHDVQRVPGLNPTSPHFYTPQNGNLRPSHPPQPEGSPQLYQQQPTRSLAEVLQQQDAYQPQQYYQPRPVQPVPSPALPKYYQAPVNPHHPAATHAPIYAESQAPRSQYVNRQVQPQRRTSSQQLPAQIRPSHNTQTPDHPSQPAQTPHHRTATHVQIPVSRQSIPHATVEMSREAKRRRSNEGKPVAVCDTPQLPPTPPPSTDYQAVLLALSDEYVSAAYAISGSLAWTDQTDDQLEEYHGLISMGMACLDSILKNFRLMDARREARIRLRLATLLYDETENMMECEEVLSKGIQLCERSKLVDLKYAMHHLLVRVTAKTSPKAATKAVEKLTAEVEALHVVHWTYAFRFLRVSLSLQAGLSDVAVVLKSLQTLADLADRRRHTAVQIVAAMTEAMVHLRSGSPDAIELAQCSLASARTHQLRDEMNALPQVRALLDCLDLACAVMQFGPTQIEHKLQQMHANMDAAAKSAGWKSNGSFQVPLGLASGEHLTGDSGGVIQTQDGEAVLTFNWLMSTQLYSMGYLLSGLATMQKDPVNPKAVSYLAEGLKLCHVTPDPLTQSLAARKVRLGWQSSLSVTIRLQQAFAHCSRSEWSQASSILSNLDHELERSPDIIDSATKAMIVYLKAVCKHSQGDLEAALLLYSDKQLIFQTGIRDVGACRDLQALATLDRIVILRGATGKQEAELLLASIESYCLTHSNKALMSAYYIVKATSDTNESIIIKRKQHLQSAVQAAQMVKNQQLLCVILSCMTEMFFRGIVGEQAIKSATAARSLAYKTHNSLWIAVTHKMYGDTAELCGEHDKAASARQQAGQAICGLSPELKKRISGRVH